MDNSILKDEIEYWSTEIQSNNKLYELAFFKIFVKFELFLTQAFIAYATGESSEKNYTPERKLDFKDKSHLEGMLRNYRSSFVDYSDKFENLSKHIFVDEKDPFSLIFNDSRLNTYYNEMKYMRNFIAHESPESRTKYEKHVLKQGNSFEEPNVYLQKINRKKSKTNYSIYIEIIQEISEVLLDPIPYF